MENERLKQLEGYAMILRGLISYHKRMMVMGAQPCQKYNADTNECVVCKDAAENNGECPKATAMNDCYLGALDESLRLINNEIAAIESR